MHWLAGRSRDAIVFEGAIVPLQARRRHRDYAGIMEAAPPDLFAREGVIEQVEAALTPRVPLPCGGALIIEPTAALVAVDVDAGPAAPATVNGEAARALARQLELRGWRGMSWSISFLIAATLAAVL